MKLKITKFVAIAGSVLLSASLSGCASGGGSVSAAEVCSRLEAAYEPYASTFEDFRYNNGSESAYTNAVDTVQSELGQLSSDIEQNSISWDSASITESLISTISSGAGEIRDAWFAGQFAPGRDVNTIVGEIESSYNAVHASACR
jgi:hypothetical protein